MRRAKRISHVKGGKKLDVDSKMLTKLTPDVPYLCAELLILPVGILILSRRGTVHQNADVYEILHKHLDQIEKFG